MCISVIQNKIENISIAFDDSIVTQELLSDFLAIAGGLFREI
jgi:hypothetical protein